MAQSELEDLVRALEAVETAADAPLDVLAGALIERQGLLDRIQNADTSQLDAAARTDLGRRVQRVADRSAECLAQLRAEQKITAEKLGELVRGRTAVRGYRPDMRRSPHQVKTRR